MKKYIFLSMIAALLFTGCVKDEQPEPLPAPGEDYSNVVINELITKDLTDPYYVDGMDEGADWIEIYNDGTNAIDIANMWVTDLPGDETQYIQIPATDPAITTIPPKGFLVLICGAKDAADVKIPTSISDGKIFIEMGLSSSSDSFISIYDPEKTKIDESQDFNGVEEDKSFGRVTDAGPDWNTLDSKTPGATNDGTLPVAGSLIINEFMCSNDTTAIPDGHPDDFPDWIEIYNTGSTPLDIGGYYITDDMADPMQYQIPTDIPEQTIIPGNGHLILYCCGIGDGIHLSFKLGSGGDDIGLSKDGVTFVDAVTYGSGSGGGTEVPTPGTDYTAGRTTDGSLEWIIFDPNTSNPPTPGTANGI